MDLHHSSCWEAILEKVKPHIPTMDFDSSSSENEEIATIYQRPAGLSLTVSEDFDLLSMDDDHLERLWKPVAPTRRTEESEQLDGDENVEGSTVTQRQLADVEGDAPQTGPVESDASVRPNNTQTTTTTAADQQLTVLSLARFDQWDLDDVLKNLDRLPLQQHVSVEPLETHADGDKEKSEAIIMERLVAFCDIQSSKNESEPMESPNHIKHTNVGNKSSGSLEDELRPRQKECPTVYIDLRCSDSSIKTPRTSPNPPSESKSPAKRSKHHETPKKVNLKVHHASCTDDSDQQRPEVKQTNAREQHQQIPEQLERHRPLKSVNQKRPAAEKTDVLYDSEASHLQSISTLPTGLESKGRMLLIVDLSSPGAVGSRAHGKRKHRISAATKSHTYNTLVAWFLSSVGRPLHDEDEAAAKVPFWVAGLQQQWTDDGLALFVLVVARHSYTPKKRNKDIHTPFYNHVCSFLTETSLPLIASWVPAVRNLLDQQAFASPIHLPSCSLNGFISTTSNKKVIDRTFGLDPGFYWQTLETPEHVCRGRETTQALHTDVSVAVGCDAFILHPVKTHYTLQLVLDSGLDVCGLRLLYPTQEFLSDRAGAGPVLQRADATCQPVLALAVRGLRAHSVLSDLTSSSDPLVPGGTDPLEPPLFFSSRPASQVHRDLCLWFSGRVSPYNRLPSRVVPSNERRGVFLCATTKTDLLLVVSPAVPPCCFGQVLAVCERRGFGLGGLQRLRLQSNGAADLGLSEQQARVFCIPRRGQLELLLPCLVLLLRKENAVHHTVCLPAALMREFKTRKLLGRIRSRVDGVRAAEPSLCFHTAPYSSNLYHVFVQCMWAVPDPSSVILSHPKSSSNSDMAILTFCGKDTRRGLSLLHRVLTEEPEGFQLLGLKWLPALTRLQARELNPHEVGQQLFQDRVGPALVCALERADALASLRKLLPQDYPGDLSVLMSPTPEVAFRQASLFFFEHEMIADLQMLVTLCLFNPTIWNHSLAKIAHKLQLCGLTMVGLRGLTLDKRTATSLLPAQSDPSDLEAHVGYLGSGSSLALCLRGGKCCKQAAGCAGPRCLVTVDPSWRGSFIQWHLWIRITSESDSGREEFFSRGALLHRDQRNETGADTQRALGPVGLCGARTELHSGPGGPGEGFTFKGIGTRHRNSGAMLKSPSQLEALEQLLGSGCHLVAGRMSILDEEQRKHIAEALKGPSRGKERAARLRAALCLVVALQGDAIVTDFDSILERIYKERQELQKVGEMIVYPECHKEANQLIRYLFDDLSGETRHHM